ncbi:M23 family metallopeptidase [Streptomyces griseoloalbus]|uniref:Murein DD-endopeptidase MepM/ murein hydrolase activator NlpD n=1 Tax=Streptomyces griseoloalbus TaxID=67303 RepID=A0A7W8FAN8_9ACTN|nr:M23 family metallopeptidase [Streptomyces albaduncus]MBB5128357.1 murein DD-endopeptidase MepM/ murein hydrolase activator NlpD [Streptomyces albaduncus]
MTRTTRVRRRLAAVALTMLASAGIMLSGASPASAADYYYELPYPAGESYLVTQGPEGTYSHTGPYNEYAWDFGLPANYEVSASQGGTIIASGWSPYWQNGIEVIIRHSNGRCTHYAHLNRALYNPGTWVRQGRVVGWSGSTGASSGPHLHFQVIDCNTRVGVPATLQGWTPYTGTWPVSVNHYA